MKFEGFLDQVQDLPVIEVENLLAGQPRADALRVQLARWHKAGKLIQLKKGFYVLDKPFRKKEVNEFYVAAILKAPSYISLEKAMEFYDLIPEAVPTFTSVTPKRPGNFKTPWGSFVYRHIASDLFWGYESLTRDKQTGFIASPEKCLLDLFYFYDGEITIEYLEGLRLQNLEKLKIGKLIRGAKRFNKPKILRAANLLGESVPQLFKAGKNFMKDYVIELVGKKEGYNQKLNILREYLQAYILKLLHQEKFFRSAAFVGGTALRFLHDLPRFSEDLDFSLDQKSQWDFEDVLANVKKELQLAQYKVSINLSSQKNVKNSMIKFNELMFEVGLSQRKEQNFSVKIDLDTNPPKGAKTETRLVNKYFPISFFSYDLSSLFAGKIHALLTRNYTKGRDFFDLGWYLSKFQNLEPNFVQLKNALVQTKWQGVTPTHENWKMLLGGVVKGADWQRVRKDVEVFLEDSRDLEMISQENVLGLLASS